MTRGDVKNQAGMLVDGSFNDTYLNAVFSKSYSKVVSELNIPSIQEVSLTDGKVVLTGLTDYGYISWVEYGGDKLIYVEYMNVKNIDYMNDTLIRFFYIYDGYIYVPGLTTESIVVRYFKKAETIASDSTTLILDDRFVDSVVFTMAFNLTLKADMRSAIVFRDLAMAETERARLHYSRLNLKTGNHTIVGYDF
jgi:hypothetical protein